MSICNTIFIGVKDIFTECSKEDDKAMKHQLAAGVSDRLVNIESFNDKTLDEHYGGANGNEVSSSSSANAKYVVSLRTLLLIFCDTPKLLRQLMTKLIMSNLY